MDFQMAKTLAVPVLKKYGVISAFVFGSVARGGAMAGSDIDILLEFAEDADPTLFKVADLRFELEAVLGRKVDVVTVSAISPYIFPFVLTEMKRILQSKNAQT